MFAFVHACCNVQRDIDLLRAYYSVFHKLYMYFITAFFATDRHIWKTHGLICDWVVSSMQSLLRFSFGRGVILACARWKFRIGIPPSARLRYQQDAIASFWDVFLNMFNHTSQNPWSGWNLEPKVIEIILSRHMLIPYYIEYTSNMLFPWDGATNGPHFKPLASEAPIMDTLYLYPLYPLPTITSKSGQSWVILLMVLRNPNSNPPFGCI